jgi:hypothetical protein
MKPLEEMNIPMYTPPEPQYWRFDREVLSWVSVEGTKGTPPWQKRVLVAVATNFRACKRIGLSEIDEKGFPLFEKVVRLFDETGIPKMEKAGLFEEKFLEFAATVGPLFYDGKKRIKTAKGERVDLGSLEEWSLFVQKVRFVHKACQAPDEGRRFAAQGTLNELLLAHPSGFQLKAPKNGPEEAFYIERWSPTIAACAIAQLSGFLVKKKTEPPYRYCHRCEKYGPQEVMSKAGFLTEDEKRIFGLPIGEEIWLHNRVKDRETDPSKVNTPSCYDYFHTKAMRYRKAAQSPE